MVQMKKGAWPKAPVSNTVYGNSFRVDKFYIGVNMTFRNINRNKTLQPNELRTSKTKQNQKRTGGIYLLNRNKQTHRTQIRGIMGSSGCYLKNKKPGWRTVLCI